MPEDDLVPDGRGAHSLERIRQYVVAGYLPYWMQQGAGPPWYPTDRWDTLPRDQVLDSPVTEWYMWLGDLIDDIEMKVGCMILGSCATNVIPTARPFSTGLRGGVW